MGFGNFGTVDLDIGGWDLEVSGWGVWTWGWVWDLICWAGCLELGFDVGLGIVILDLWWLVCVDVYVYSLIWMWDCRQVFKALRKFGAPSRQRKTQRRRLIRPLQPRERGRRRPRPKLAPRKFWMIWL